MEQPKSVEIIPFEGPRDLATVTARPPALFLSEPKASERFWEFFTANIRNRNSRRALNVLCCPFRALIPLRASFPLPSRRARGEPWSNGPVEGQLNRLKMLKRQMYGRAGIELLRARLLPEPRV